MTTLRYNVSNCAVFLILHSSKRNADANDDSDTYNVGAAVFYFQYNKKTMYTHVFQTVSRRQFYLLTPTISMSVEVLQFKCCLL